MLRVLQLGAALGPISWFEAVLLTIIGVLALMIWVLTHHQECHYDGEPEGSVGDGLPALAGSTHGMLTGGNAVRLFQDAAFFDAVVDDIRKARNSVNLETYMWKSGEAAEMITEALVEAAGRGVVVRMMVDDRGGAGLSSDTRRRLEEAGCRVARFHKLSLRNLGRWNIRDHRKILVVDGRIAYVGGHCITDLWLKDQPERRRHRDITARLSGPVVGAVQSAFTENWEEVSDEVFVDASTFPVLEPQGSVRAHAAYVRPQGCPSAVQILHFLAIAYAKKSIRIQNPYFVPDAPLCKALVKAVRRGVDVRVMVPSFEANDTPVVAYASRSKYGPLLKEGVRIFEYQPALLHQKIITIDGSWCGIGSCNFDDRSFEINDEIVIGIEDRETIAELEETFERDVADCREQSFEEWKSRGWWKRLIDRFFHLFNEQF